MGALAIAGLIFELVNTYGPKAKQIYDDWASQVPEGTEPTKEMWDQLKAKIDSHDPDTY
jgi:hypothetical protein